MIRPSTFIIIVYLAISSVFAQGGPPRQSSLSVGAFAGVRNSEYLSEKNKTLVLPAIQGHIGRFSLDGRGIAYRALGPFPIALSFKAEYFSAGFDPKRAPELAHLKKRRGSLHLGPELRVPLPQQLSFRVRASQDVLGVSNGHEGSVGLSRFFFLGPKYQFIPFIGMTYWSSRLMREYYGVSEAEAIERIPAYTPQKDIFPQATVFFIINFSEEWLGNAFASTTILSSEAKRSPLTSSSTRTFMGFGLSRKF
jgi:outer membrane scaffolding protein for murein synthesis (MipA/OmpV family)